MTHGTVLKSTCPYCPAMRCATATPSSSALCASIGPRTTSPIAQTFGRFVRHSPSTATKPRSSSLRPTPVAFERLRAFIRGRVLQRDALLARRHLGDADAELDGEPLLGKDLRRLPRDLLVGGAEKRRQGLEDRHLRAETPPDAAHLEADDAGADHTEALRHLGDRQRAGVAEDQLLVEVDARQLARIRTGRDDHVLCAHGLVGDAELVAIGGCAYEACAAGEELDLVLAEKIGDAVVARLHRLVLALHHLREV